MVAVALVAMVMIVSVGICGATLAVHPARVAVHVVLFLPDGHTVLHFIDDETAGLEGFVAVGG